LERKRQLRGILLESLLIAAAGAGLAFAANALSPRGLKLTRDYFPESPAAAAVLQRQTIAATNAPSPVQEAAAAVRAEGFHVIGTAQMKGLVNDPRREEGLILILDARGPKEFEAGHIPGAHEFYYYAPENYLPTVLPLCQMARQIVVYCNGGQCEDSRFAAVFLRDSADVPAARLYVYVGGMTAWRTNGLPVEAGSQGGGNAPASN
jgi:rhodanese-related sulfurtransferase